MHSELADVEHTSPSKREIDTVIAHVADGGERLATD
jgi:hypothetical protein